MYEEHLSPWNKHKRRISPISFCALPVWTLKFELACARPGGNGSPICLAISSHSTRVTRRQVPWGRCRGRDAGCSPSPPPQGGAQGFRRRQALPLRAATAGASHCQAWGAHEPRTEEAQPFGGRSCDLWSQFKASHAFHLKWDPEVQIQFSSMQIFAPLQNRFCVQSLFSLCTYLLPKCQNASLWEITLVYGHPGGEDQGRLEEARWCVAIDKMLKEVFLHSGRV